MVLETVLGTVKKLYLTLLKRGISLFSQSPSLVFQWTFPVKLPNTHDTTFFHSTHGCKKRGLRQEEGGLCIRLDWGTQRKDRYRILTWRWYSPYHGENEGGPVPITYTRCPPRGQRIRTVRNDQLLSRKEVLDLHRYGGKDRLLRSVSQTRL